MRTTMALLGAAALAAALCASGGSAARAAGSLLDCAFAPDGGDKVQTMHACASISATGALELKESELDHLTYDGGLATVQVGKLFFYVDEKGRSAPVASVEGRPVEFHDGLAPSPRLIGGGYRIGYIDRSLRLVIPPRWDGGLDFEGGRAQVCRGCKVARDGDFAELQGGVWGCIDTAGREVVPVEQPSPDGLDCAAEK
jgi:hypothetical protein